MAKPKHSDNPHVRWRLRLNWALRRAWSLMWMSLSGYVTVIALLFVVDQWVNTENPLWQGIVYLSFVPMVGVLLAALALVVLAGAWLIVWVRQQIGGKGKRKPKRHD